jgi:hypothetical protein
MLFNTPRAGYFASASFFAKATKDESKAKAYLHGTSRAISGFDGQPVE